MNRTLAASLWTAFYVCHGAQAWADVPSTVRYNLYDLPSARTAMQTLSRDVSIFWDKKPLREGVQQLSTTYGVSIWFDRRIDPNQLIDFSVKPDQVDRSLGTILRQIAALAQADAALIENVVYFGPTSTSAKLQRAAVELHDLLSRSKLLSKSKRSKDAELRMMRWSELSTPGSLVASVSEQWDIRVEHSLPHDLLHQGELVQPCTLATQLTLICSGFDLQANLVRPGRFRFGQLDDRTKWQCTYKTDSLNSQSMKPNERSRLKRIHIGSSLIERAGQCTLVGPTRFHLNFLKPSPSKEDRGQPLGNQSWSFEVKNTPAEIVINSLASSIGLHVTWDNAIAAAHREQLVSFSVESASIDKLLKAFADAANLNVVRTQRSVLISP